MVYYFLSDLVVSAPYEPSTSSTANNGSVYIYYGGETREDIVEQEPQRVSGFFVTQAALVFHSVLSRVIWR